MNTTPTYVAEQIAREYMRGRIHEAEARQAVRVARAARRAARERQHADPTGAAVSRVRRWWGFEARTTTA